MNKEILIITGSPRRNGNTQQLAGAFKAGAEQSGHHVTVFDAASRTIGGCIACDTCWSRGTACSFTDGFTELEPLLEKADVIVLASPLYWFGLSAQIKAPIDKLYAYVREACLRPLKIKESVLLVCAGDSEEMIFDGVIGSYKNMCRYLNWQDRGMITVSGVYAIGDIDNHEALKQAELLGMDI